METVQGIRFENDANGKPISVHIDLEKYGTIIEPFLEQIGVISDEDKFEKDWENAISLKEAKQISIDKIRGWWKK